MPIEVRWLEVGQKGLQLVEVELVGHLDRVVRCLLRNGSFSELQILHVPQGVEGTIEFSPTRTLRASSA